MAYRKIQWGKAPRAHCHDRSIKNGLILKGEYMKKYISLFALLSFSMAVQAGCCEGNCCEKPVSQPQKQVVRLSEKQDKDCEATQVKQTVQQAYSQVDHSGSCDSFGGGCCGGGSDLSKYIGYSKEQLDDLELANLGLGCGNPTTLGELKTGYVVVDLGSGAGLDSFLAAKKVGPTGKVIGVDMTPDMICKSQENAKKYGIENVEFRLGDIEKLPVKSNSVDVVMSNCVINLAPDKLKVFQEAYRVLKPNGKMFVSDVVLLGSLSAEQKRDANLLCVCVGGALPKGDYISLLQSVGFDVAIIDEDREINKKWFNSDELPISSLKYVATK